MSEIVKYLRGESNPDLRFRKPLFYPLNYGGKCGYSGHKDSHSARFRQMKP